MKVPLTFIVFTATTVLSIEGVRMLCMVNGMDFLSCAAPSCVTNTTSPTGLLSEHLHISQKYTVSIAAHQQQQNSSYSLLQIHITVVALRRRWWQSGGGGHCRVVSLCLPLKLLLAPRQLSEPDKRQHRCPAPRPPTKSKMAAVTRIRWRLGGKWEGHKF